LRAFERRAARRALLDLAVVGWVALWVGMGYYVDQQVSGISHLGGTVVLAGGAIRQTTDALDLVGDVPFVGDRVRKLSRSARRTADSAIVNGRAAQRDVDQLAVLLWATVAAAPTVPVLTWYAVALFRRRRLS
jgi:hypothetical protein